MCRDTSRLSRGGALVVLSSPIELGRAVPSALVGNLVFHDRGQGTDGATHVTITSPTSDFSKVTRCVIGIHETGDLTKPARASRLIHKFDFRRVPGIADVKVMEYQLKYPVDLAAGDSGIIGRRVTVWMQRDEPLVGEGIVGYN